MALSGLLNKSLLGLIYEWLKELDEPCVNVRGVIVFEIKSRCLPDWSEIKSNLYFIYFGNTLSGIIKMWGSTCKPWLSVEYFGDGQAGKGKRADSGDDHRQSKMKLDVLDSTWGLPKFPAQWAFFSLQPIAVVVKLSLSQQTVSLNWTNPCSRFSGWKWCAAEGEEKIKWSLTLVLCVRIQFKEKILMLLCNYGLRTSLHFGWFIFILNSW